jgi:hypothetical protein
VIDRLVLCTAVTRAACAVLDRDLLPRRERWSRSPILLDSTALEQLADARGFLCGMQSELGRADAFESGLAASVDARRDGGRAAVVVRSPLLLGSDPLGAADLTTLRPFAECAIEQVVRALAPRRTDVLVGVQRPDRMIEAVVSEELGQVPYERIVERFPHRFRTPFDHAALVDRLRAVGAVRSVFVAAVDPPVSPAIAMSRRVRQQIRDAYADVHRRLRDMRVLVDERRALDLLSGDG